MWAVRRASNFIKSRGVDIVISRTCYAKSKMPSRSSVSESQPGLFECRHEICGSSLKRVHNTTYVSTKLSLGRFGISSQAGAENSEENDELSELEVTASNDTIQHCNADKEMVSETEYSAEDDVEEASQNELDVLDSGIYEEKSLGRKAPTKLFKTIIGNSNLHDVLDRWVAEGKSFDRDEVSQVMLDLRKRRMFGRALQISEWLESKKHIDFAESDYASRVDLIAKVRGLQKAEKYVGSIPQPFRGEVIYRTLLANFVMVHNMKKAEETFNKMKDLKFPITTFSCNQLLLLYKRLDKKRIAGVLLLMEKEDVSPSLFTYKILIDTKGLSKDITGMDQLVETMKAEGIEPDNSIRFVLAKHYISSGLKEKAEAILKEMEGDNLSENRLACRFLLRHYSALGKADEVRRVWKVCESKPRLNECAAAIEAWGKLKNVEEAEAVFEGMLKTWNKVLPKHWSALLKVYVNNKMLDKGKDLVKRMEASGGHIGPLTWDSLIKLYVEAGDVEKADTILQRAAQQRGKNPMLVSYMAIMDQYAERGDVHNTEKIFHRVRQVGYIVQNWQFQTLIQAYLNARTPLYGIRERMKADNVFPNKALVNQLKNADPFRKTAVSDLFD